jgi:hypothetical protein
MNKTVIALAIAVAEIVTEAGILIFYLIKAPKKVARPEDLMFSRPVKMPPPLEEQREFKESKTNEIHVPQLNTNQQGGTAEQTPQYAKENPNNQPVNGGMPFPPTGNP